MCCEQLVCASCAHPVMEARCEVCRDVRSAMHGGSQALPVTWLAVSVIMLLAVAAALYSRFAA
jgi:hypothetical protein